MKYFKLYQAKSKIELIKKNIFYPILFNIRIFISNRIQTRKYH